jgi:hypothetical protein
MEDKTVTFKIEKCILVDSGRPPPIMTQEILDMINPECESLALFHPDLKTELTEILKEQIEIELKKERNMEDKVQIANILLTRRCNLSCSYCNLVRNYPGIPKEYTDMRQYTADELTGEEWIDIFKRLVKNNKDVFFVIYGGEPFVYEDLWKIIKYCNENNVYYTVISNNTDYVQDKIKAVYEKCGQYRGFTSSVDPVVDEDDESQVEFSNSEKGKFFITKKSNDEVIKIY